MGGVPCVVGCHCRPTRKVYRVTPTHGVAFGTFSQVNPYGWCPAAGAWRVAAPLPRSGWGTFGSAERCRTSRGPVRVRGARGRSAERSGGPGSSGVRARSARSGRGAAGHALRGEERSGSPRTRRRVERPPPGIAHMGVRQVFRLSRALLRPGPPGFSCFAAPGGQVPVMARTAAVSWSAMWSSPSVTHASGRKRPAENSWTPRGS